ncbi:hypothetical protein TL16_g02712 [Triparma laevis f. inornata]|uniref:Uncharacterized protein n=1 Tax=Triparma laevis f. inornata TaxID=1714386 RepID=A0A9W6ZZY2_9STRA|nr:hypothetical protein TL16_g02712 [Triparma laevis f. inornata]
MIELSSLYSTFVLPSTPILQNNNNIEAHSTMIDDESVMVVPSIFPYHASTSAPSNVIFDVSVDVEKSADVESMVNHVQASVANSAMPVAKRYFSTM